MTLPPLPEPDTHCFDDDTRRDVWSYSERRMRAYAEQAVAAERERCALQLEATGNDHCASALRNGPNVRAKRGQTAPQE